MPKLKIPYKIQKIFAAGKTLLMWMPFIWHEPKRIRFFPEWLFSFWPQRSAYEDGFPLVTFEAREWMDSFLNKNMKVFEWGSGGSTLFLADKVKTLVSIEHNPEWYEKIGRLIKERGFSNCQYILKESEPGNDYFSSSPRYKGLSFKEYCQAIDSYPDESFDLVLIDGRARNFCISRAIKKIHPNGFLFLDDSDGLGYAEGLELLKKWEQKEFRGPKPYAIKFHQATICRKPVL